MILIFGANKRSHNTIKNNTNRQILRIAVKIKFLATFFFLFGDLPTEPTQLRQPQNDSLAQSLHLKHTWLVSWLVQLKITLFMQDLETLKQNTMV